MRAGHGLATEEVGDGCTRVHDTVFSTFMTMFDSVRNKNSKQTGWPWAASSLDQGMPSMHIAWELARAVYTVLSTPSTSWGSILARLGPQPQQDL